MPKPIFVKNKDNCYEMNNSHEVEYFIEEVSIDKGEKLFVE